MKVPDLLDDLPNESFPCGTSKGVLTCTAPTFKCSIDTTSLLARSTKFVPVPLDSKCHGRIWDGVNDFIRKLQWRSVKLTNRALPRFFKPSERFPPAGLVPARVLDRCCRIREQVALQLHRCRCCFPEDNLSSEERDEMQRLASAPDVMVTPVDKGGGWMIVPRSSYDAEAYRQLTNEDFYEPASSDPDRHVLQRLKVLLTLLREHHFISRREFLALQPPSSPSARLFYLLPKLHKSSWCFSSMPPGRPIVSDVDSVTRACASLVEHFLGPLARQNESYVRDSTHLMASLLDFTVPAASLLVTLDVISLYTNIPTDEGIAAVRRAFLRHPDPQRPDLTILTMISIILKNNFFLFRGERFLQLSGTAMGCAFGSSFANIFLGDWEDKIFEFYKPPFWRRFIDDIFLIWPLPSERLFSFVDFVNSIAPTIKVELVFDRFSIRFLDLLLTKKGERLHFKIGFKPTDSHTILSPSSFHPSHVFKAIVFGQVYRWVTHSSSYEAFKETKRTVQTAWRQQGYSRSAIRNAVRRVLAFTDQQPSSWQTGFFPCDCEVCFYSSVTKVVVNTFNFDSYLILHHLTCLSSNVIYLITCTSCGIRYVGQTARPVHFRIKEHLRHITTGRPTPVASHFLTSCSLTDFSFTVLEHCPNEEKRLQKENQWIGRLHTLSPEGLNIQLNRNEKIHLVLPFSQCSARVANQIRRVCDDVTTSFTRHKNLVSILTANARL